MKTSFLREPIKVLPREPRASRTSQGYGSWLGRFDAVPRRGEKNTIKLALDFFRTPTAM